MEPFEYLVVEAPTDQSGSVMRLVLERQGECVKMEGGGLLTHMEFHIPARGLIGLRTKMLTATQGNAIMHHNFLEYRPVKGAFDGRSNGVLVSIETAKATAYAIEGLQDRGTCCSSRPWSRCTRGKSSARRIKTKTSQSTSPGSKP